MKQKNLETSSFSLRDEIEKVRSLPKEQRLDYLWTYYKTTLFIGIALLVVAWMVISFAVSAFIGTFFPKEPISIAVVAQHWDDAGLQSWVEGCKEAIGYEEKKEDLQILTSTGPSEYSDNFNISCTLWLSAGQPDIFICNQSALNYLLEQDVLMDLTTFFSLEFSGEGTYWIDVTDSAFAEAAGIPEEPLYLCMYINGSGLTRAVDIVNFLLSE